MKNLFVMGAVSAVAAAASVFSLFSAENTEMKLREGERIAVVGDDLVDQKCFTRMADVYLAACSGVRDIRLFQFSRWGETSQSFSERMRRDVAFWKPDVVAVQFSLSDFQYAPYKDTIQKKHLDSLTAIIDFFKDSRAHVILISPAGFDTETFRGNKDGIADQLNLALDRYTRAELDLAVEKKTAFANVYSEFMTVMKAAKGKYGKQYHLAGPDGSHPWENGHLLIATQLLKKLGAAGPIARISMDFSGGPSMVSAGHKILSSKPGMLEIESTRYPFCFPPPREGADPGDIQKILPFLSFQNDLNLFELRVSGLKKNKARVSFGSFSKNFASADLEKGINLASEFPDNPFSQSFNGVVNAVNEKQNFESMLFRNFVETQLLADRLKISDEGRDAFKIVIREMRAKHEDYCDRVAKSVVPVRYTITVTELEK